MTTEELVLSMYSNEPCRICGRLISMEDIHDDRVVFAGYSDDNKSRTAHKLCFLNAREVMGKRISELENENMRLRTKLE